MSTPAPLLIGMDYHDRLRKARVVRGLTQTQLGMVLGVRTSTVSLVERGRQRPGFELVAAWARECGADLAWIAYGQPPSVRLVPDA